MKLPPVLPQSDILVIVADPAHNSLAIYCQPGDQIGLASQLVLIDPE